MAIQFSQYHLLKKFTLLYIQLSYYRVYYYYLYLYYFPGLLWLLRVFSASIQGIIFFSIYMKSSIEILRDCFAKNEHFNDINSISL